MHHVHVWVSIFILHLKSEAEELRLVGGRTECEGRVEVKYQGEWGTVCDDYWEMDNTAVVCKQLGCDSSHGQNHSFQFSWFGSGTGNIWLDDVNCTGVESALWECPHSGWGIHDCDHGEDIEVLCEGEAEELRLVGGRTECEGRVEVKHQGEWGTVCDDYWNMDSTAVVCKQLGCDSSHGQNHSFQVSSYGDGTGSIWLDDVNCTGAESALWECNHPAWGKNDCGHNEDIGVICDGRLSVEDIEITPYVTRKGTCRVILLCTVNKYSVDISWHSSNKSGIIVDNGLLQVTAMDLNVSFICVAQNPVSAVNRTVIPRQYCLEEQEDPGLFVFYGFLIAKGFAILFIGLFVTFGFYQRKENNDKDTTEEYAVMEFRDFDVNK